MSVTPSFHGFSLRYSFRDRAPLLIHSVTDTTSNKRLRPESDFDFHLDEPLEKKVSLGEQTKEDIAREEGFIAISNSRDKPKCQGSTLSPSIDTTDTNVKEETQRLY